MSWDAENEEKLAAFLARAGRADAPRLAVFDADNTLWSGDVGETALLHLARNLAFSERLPEILPERLPVTASADGRRPAGWLFPAARLREALDVARAAWGRRCPELPLSAFREEMVEEGGALADEVRLVNAWRLYQGVIVGAHDGLDESAGRVGLDEAQHTDVTELFPEDVRPFFSEQARVGTCRGARDDAGRARILSSRFLDAGPDQARLRREGRLGSYTQIAAWTALDRTPDELFALGRALVEGSKGQVRRCATVFPVDTFSEQGPAPLDWDQPFLHPAQAVGAGVVLGEGVMSRGVAVRPPIRALLDALQAHGVRPLVVSASQRDLVEGVVCAWYGLPRGQTWGMQHRLEGGRYTGELLEPVPYGLGKIAATQHLMGGGRTPPLLCAGDANTDLELVAWSGDMRIFFDRGGRPFMDMARRLVAEGAAARTVTQRPFEQ